jgi:ABC-type phosphate transport system substrate-binding protein
VDAFLAACGITEDKHKKQKREWDNALKRVRNVETRRARSRRSRRGILASVGAAVLLPGAAIASYLQWPFSTAVSATCVPGQLTIQGSTAFTPAATALSQAYQAGCAGARVTVVGDGSIGGLDSLSQSGSQGAASSIAMSDGAAPGDAFAKLHGTPVAVVVFDIVVNASVGVSRLTTGQVIGIYAGSVTNWDQVGGPNLPIRLVSRDAESGTRRTFEQRVLGTSEPPVSSFDCMRKDRDPAAKVTRCEEASTLIVLDKVATTPGAIGYAESEAAQQNQGVTPVTLDGRNPGVPGSAAGNSYAFWNVEYLYTYGQLPYQAPASGLLRYMTTPAAREILRAQGLISCYDQAQHLIAACQSLSFGLYGVRLHHRRGGGRRVRPRGAPREGPARQRAADRVRRR